MNELLHGVTLQEIEQRREALIKKIVEEYDQPGLIVLFADLEGHQHAFTQESTFYYFSGITEPGVALTISTDGDTTLYIPAFTGSRAQWVRCLIEPTKACAQALGVSHIKIMGEPLAGYSVPFFAPRAHYQTLIEDIKHAQNKGLIFAVGTTAPTRYTHQHILFQHILASTIDIKHSRDISHQIGQLRRIKSHRELERLYNAVQITEMAHEAAASVIKKDTFERDAQARLEFVMKSAGAAIAFPSIVATGGNGAILHYVENDQQFKSGDLVVIDIGAQVDHYCADISRTYPVSGKFNERQAELYTIVLDTQKFVESQARPGMWLNNKEHPSQSLHHLAVQFLQDKGYAQYFVHGIGHFLGLDVHDVGDTKEPLQEGDVITIEPGIYIAQEKLGIRIEDDYWIVADGAECLSAVLPKEINAIQQFMCDAQKL